MNAPLKADVTLSQFVIIDVQSRLATVMPSDAMQAVLKNCSILAQTASLLDVAMIVTEQYPKGLGHTIPELSALMPNIHPVDKTTFSCLAESKFRRQLTRDHSQMILSGMETHICIVQTALDLIDAGKQVFVVEDAVISRNPANKANALARMRDAGCVITNTESVVFEWLGAAESEVFKAVSKLIR
jgi:nicotinamidase-related amidase